MFVDDLQFYDVQNNYIMAGLDIESLYSSIHINKVNNVIFGKKPL